MSDTSDLSSAEAQPHLNETQQQLDAVQASQRLLNTTLRSIGDAVIATDREGRITFMNGVAEQLTGWKEIEARGVLCSEVFRITNQETGKTVESPVDRVLREGVVVGLANHTILTARGGTRYPIDDSGAPIRDAQGNLFGVVLVFRDVTEQKRAAEIRERLAAIVEFSDDAIMSKDLNGLITSWNPAAERLYGYTAQEAIGKSKAIVIPASQPDELATILRHIKQGERIDHYETKRIRKNGEMIDVSVSVSPVKDSEGQIVGASTIARDITRQKREEIRQRFLLQAGEILSSSLDYRQTLQAVTHLAVPKLADWCTVDMLDVDGTIRLLAAAHVDPEKLQWGIAFREEYPPDPNSPRGTANVLRTGQPERYPDIPDEVFVRSARSEQHLASMRQFGIISVMIVPMKARGRVLGAISFVATTESGQRYTEEDQALAESLAARAALAVDNAQLYQAAQQEIAQREKTEEELRRRQAEIETLNVRLRRAMAETHHRVKNNLQVVSALVELQAADAGEVVPTVTLRRVGQHVRALATIHEILTEEAREEGEVEYLSTKDALTKLRPLLQSIVGARRIDFHIEDLRLPIRLGTSLAVLINELVSNAVKHGEGDIDLSLTVEGEQGRLEVRDMGAGFPEDFDPQTAANTGLELIQSLGRWDLRGDLTFQNHPEGGAHVTVVFPLTTT